MYYVPGQEAVRAGPQVMQTGPLSGAAGGVCVPMNDSVQAVQTQGQMQGMPPAFITDPRILNNACTGQPAPPPIGAARKEAIHEHSAVLRGLTVSEPEWEKFLCESLILTDKCNVERHPLMKMSGQYVLSGQFERWCKRMPERLVSPAVLATFAPDQTAATLLNFVLDTLQQSQDMQSASSSNALPPANVWGEYGQGTRVMSASTKLSEVDKRESTTLQSDGVAAMGDPNVGKVLTDIMKKMDCQDYVGAEALVRVAIGIDGKLQRLLTMGDDDLCRAALAGHCIPAFDLAITRIRSMMQRRLEELLSTKNTQPSERFSKGVAAVRVGKMSKLRVRYLLDMDDAKWTKDKPLASFMDNSRGMSLGTFGHCMSKLSQVWTFSDPANTLAIHGFINAVTDCVFRGDEAGMPWSSSDGEYSISHLWASLMRKCDSTQDACMMGGRAAARSAPNKEWCTDTSFEWVRLFDSACAASAAQRAATTATKKLLDEAKAASKVKQETAAGKRQATQDPPETPKVVKAKPNTRTKSAAKNMGQAAPPPTPAATATPVAAPAAASSRGGADAAAELLRVHGTKVVNGVTKLPCHFFFTKGACSFNEDKCRCHHG